MKANRAPKRRFGRDEEGISVIVGALVFLAILVSTLLNVRLQYVPVWEENSEAAHMRTVERQLATLHSELLRQAENRSAAFTSSPISMEEGGSSAFAPPRLSPSLRYESTNRTINLSAPSLLILSQNDQSLVGVSESWVNIVGNGTLTNVSEVENFRIRIDDVNKENDGDNITLTLRDATGAFAGDFRVEVDDPSGQDIYIRIRVRDASQTVVFEGFDSRFQNNIDDTFWTDVLNPEYRFDRIFTAAAPPANITLQEFGISGEYTITYLQSTSSGSVVVGGSGVPRVNYTESFSGGSLSFLSRNNFFVDQTYILENGALILSQVHGAVFKIDPAFDVDLVGNQTVLRMTLPNLAGVNASASIRGTTTVRAVATSQTSYTAQAARYNFTIQSAFPELWAAHWRRELTALSGFNESEEFNITTTANSARLDLRGVDSAAGSTNRDILVTMRQSSVNVILEI